VLQAIALSKAPVIASHSAVRTLANHSRNMDDEMLMALKTNGGVIQVVAFSAYIKANPPERAPAITALQREFGVRSTTGGAARGTPGRVPRPCPVEKPGLPAAAASSNTVAPASLTAERRAEYDRRMKAIDSKWPAAPRATVTDFVDHIEYTVKLIGIDHVGISSDFDGGGGIAGWNSAAEAFNVTLELVRRGYTEEQIAKIWGGNLLRVWGDVEKVARQIQGRG
jgi:membrane dipeptidase